MNWHIDHKIASGTFGAVYKVRHKQTAQTAALKIIHQHLNRPAERRRIKRGFLSAAQIDHPNCVRLIEWLEMATESEPPDVGFVMEFVEGRSIIELRQQPLKDIIPVLIQLCNGLDALHRHHITHRDLKPENILLTADQQVKITDFDLVKLDDSLAFTSAGTFLGTARYASPEQCNDASQVDPRSDLYSLGVIFYELVTGKLPFDGDNFMDIAAHHLWSEPLAPSTIRPDLPSTIETIILKLLAKNPADRYQNARQVALALQNTQTDDVSTVFVDVEAMSDYLLPPRFVGRTNELRRLERAWLSTQQGQGQIVLVSGEAGLGKTRLWEAFVGSHLRQGRVVSIRCRAGESSLTPLRRLVEQVRPHIPPDDLATAVGPFGRDLAQLTPDMSASSAWKSLPEVPDLTGAAAELRLFETVASVIRFVADLQPLAINFDNGEQAGATLTRFVEYLSRQTDKTPVLLTILYRSEPGPWADLARTLDRAQVIALHPLGSEAVLEMVNSMLGHASHLPIRLIDSLMARTGGNPLFVRETITYLFDRKLLKRAQDRWEIEDASLSETALPRSVQAVLQERLDQLSDDGRTCLQAAAVLGSRFEFETLRRLLDWSEDRLMLTLGQSHAVHLIGESATDGSAYHFAFDMLVDLLEQELEPEKRQSWHRQVGLYLEAEDEARPERLARHFAAASDAEKAASYHEQAGDAARTAFANEQAIYHFSQASQFYQTSENIMSSVNVLSRLAEVQKLTGHVERAQENWEQALTLAKTHLTAEKQWPVQRWLGILHTERGENDQATAYLATALELAEQLTDSEAIAKVVGSLGNLHYRQGDLDGAMQFYERGLNLSRKLGDMDGEAAFIGNIGIVHTERGELDPAIACYEQKIKLNEQTGNLREMAQAAGNLGVVFWRQGAINKAAAYFEDKRRLCQKIGDQKELAAAIGNIGLVHLQKDELDAAHKCFTDYQDLSERLGNQRGVSMAVGNLGLVLSKQGQIDTALECFQQQLDLCQRLNDPAGAARAAGNMAGLYLDRNDLDRAEQLLSQAAELFESVNDRAGLVGVATSRGQIAQQRGEARHAVTQYEHALSLSREIGFQHNQPDVLLKLTEAHLSLDDPTAARQTLDEAIKLSDEVGDAAVHFRSQLLSAHIDYQSGASDLAIKQLETLLKTAVEETELAEVHDAIWRINQDEGHRQAALSHYQSLHKETPNPVYQQKIEELTPIKSQLPEPLPQKPPAPSGSPMLLPMIKSLIQLMNPTTAYPELLKLLTEQCRADNCHIIMQDVRTKELEVRAISSGLNDPDAVALSRGILLQAIEQNRAVCVPNAVESVEYGDNPSIVGKQFVSVIVVPLRSGHRSIGALYLDRHQIKYGPFDAHDLEQVQTVADFLTPALVRQETLEAHRATAEIERFESLIGTSQAMQRIFREVEKYAPVDATVYIHGETGTGKELIARALHKLSPRQGRSFVPINCAALPKDLVESELFGHEAGAFTGARSLKKGKFELATGGTILLDEIGELPLDIQAKLLRVIENRELSRVGGNHILPVDVRLLVATHKDLQDEVRAGRFREDLYFRLNVLKIEIPPLRDRPADIPLLAYEFVRQFNERYQRQVAGLTVEAIAALQAHRWPGNVRELKHTIEKAIVAADKGEPLTAADLLPDQPMTQPIIGTSPSLYQPGQPLSAILKQVECQVVADALERNNWHKTNTAKELGIGRPRLDKIIRECELRRVVGQGNG